MISKYRAASAGFLASAILVVGHVAQAATVLSAGEAVIQNSLGIGLATSSNDTFDDDVLRLKQNILRIHFEDTTTTAGFPGNDWRILINDIGSGGANYFAVEDSTANRVPFKIEAGARANALVVQSDGDIGIGTATPNLRLELLKGDTPGIRMQQDNSAGWTPQSWDMAGNEANFFVRDVTHASQTPFRIIPNSPHDQLVINTGGVGVGIKNPIAGNLFHVNASLANQRVLIGTADNGVTNALLNVNGPAYFQGDVEVGSSRAFKEDIHPLDGISAQEALEKLQPVTFRYNNTSEPKVGFIAEDVPDLVATSNHKSLSPMDFIAVLTSVVQAQQTEIAELKRCLGEIEAAATTPR